METLLISIKSKKDSKLIKELLMRFDVSITNWNSPTISFPKKKLTAKDIRAMAGSLKGQLISKEHLRSISWKKRNW